VRIIQISDTHVSRTHPQFATNLRAIKGWLVQQQADLIVNTGDLSMNGAVTANDLEDAVSWHRDLGVPVLCIPGNHDVGDVVTLRADQVLDEARLERYRGIVGPDQWIRDEADWRLVGINAMLCGTGHRDEDEQEQWLAGALDTSKRVALFLHKPLYFEDPAEGPKGYWTITPDPRHRLLDIMGRADVKLVASGHLHVARREIFAGQAHVWGPSSAFVCGPSQTNVPGERRIGVTIHDLTPDRSTSRFVFLDSTSDLTIDPHLDEIYPKPLGALAETQAA
jgi:3',5'-cyclic AMP phosphodiesterase CpdA